MFAKVYGQLNAFPIEKHDSGGSSGIRFVEIHLIPMDPVAWSSQGRVLKEYAYRYLQG